MTTLRDLIEKSFKIRNKAGALQLLSLNEPQEHVYRLFQQEYNAGKPVRFIILKARQHGISTLTEAIMFGLTITHHNRNGLIVAHDNDSTNNIYTMTRLFFDELPDFLKPKVQYSNARLLTFDDPAGGGLKSSIRVNTAGSEGIARGSTFQYVHLSEVAFWGDRANDIMLGIFQAVPSLPETMIVIESTANGFNHFKTMWDNAVRGESDYIPIFLPWFVMPSYRMPYDGTPLTQDEQELKKTFNLDDEQIQWRRYTIRNNCNGDIDKFRQEYPSTPEEAFLLSGDPVFDNEKLLKQSARIAKPLERGVFEVKRDGDTIISYDLKRSDNGLIWIYEKPSVSAMPYTIGSDTAGEGSDYFVAYVVDRHGKTCAKLRMQSNEPEYVRQLYCLGKYYYNALLVPESNFSTYPTLKLQEMGYINIYVREVFDTYTNTHRKSYGFKTTSITRPVIIANLKSMVNDDIELITDGDLINEMLTFVNNDKGRPEAAAGAHDDCVMAYAITMYCRSQSILMAEQEQEEQEDGYDSFFSYGE